jgi:hypothetical protein
LWALNPAMDLKYPELENGHRNITKIFDADKVDRIIEVSEEEAEP